MKEIWVSEAFDGKIFRDEEECREYERNLKESILLKNIKFYDLHDNLLNIKELYDINNILYDIHKIVIPSDEDCNMLNDWLEEYCVYEEEICFPKKGTWYFVPVTSIEVVSEDEITE